MCGVLLLRVLFFLIFFKRHDDEATPEVSG